ncbi:MAG: beta-lactamase family protein [Hamadaea sp.]|nr:beta-lactamase family protein [Hamadaea sp.]
MELDRVIEAAPMPAVAVTVFDGAGLRWQSVRGTADLTTGETVTPEHWWDLASLTKTLVTLPEALSRWDLDAALADVWPRAVHHEVGRATVRQLVAHTAGLPATVPFFRSAASRSDVVEQVLATPLERPPGTDAAYSDLGFLLLGEALQDVTGDSLATLARRRSGFRFGPLPPATPVVATERCAWRGRLIRGDVHDENAFAMGGVAGHAGAFGTLDLVVAAARAWYAEAVVEPRLHAEVRSLQGTNAAGERFGLGWWLPPTRGLGGADPGPGSYGCSGFVGNRIWLEPERGYGVVVLSNRIHPDRDTRAAFNAWCAELLAAVADSLSR